MAPNHQFSMADVLRDFVTVHPSRTISIRGLGAEQMADEEILHAALAVRAAHAVAAAGHHEQVEVLVGLDERVDESHRRFRRDVVVHLADDQEQLALVFRNNASSRNFATGFADLLSMSPDEHSRAVSGLLNALYLFSSSDVANVSKKSDFRMKDIGREPTLLLIGAPLADARRSEVLSAIILSRAFNSVYDRFQFGGQERKCPVFFMIDEAARLKDRIVYEEVLSVVRSAGAGVCLALQDVTQLGDVEERTAILASCHTMITLRGCSPETAKYLAGRLGGRWQSNVVEGTARGLFDPFPRDQTRQVQSTGADVLGQREIMHPPAGCGRWCGVVHIPSISAKPFLIDLERDSL